MQNNRFSGRLQRGHSNRRGFTLVEILVVLSIIAILAAILLPMLSRAQERARQTSCQTNLQQIYTAVRLYRDDENRYPSTLAVLLPSDSSLNYTATITPAPARINGQDCDTTKGTCPNTRGTGYLKSTKNILCPDDDTNQSKPIATYGDVSTYLPGSMTPEPAPPAGTVNDATQMSRFVWNYWGYKDNGTAYVTMTTNTNPATTDTSPAAVNARAYVADLNAPVAPATTPDQRFLVNPAQPYNVATNPVDVQKTPRLANRYAPSNTIITHCIWHRIPLSSALGSPNDLYTSAANDDGARDIVLRLDGSAGLEDIVPWKTAKTWVKQK